MKSKINIKSTDLQEEIPNTSKTSTQFQQLIQKLNELFLPEKTDHALNNWFENPIVSWGFVIAIGVLIVYLAYTLA